MSATGRLSWGIATAALFALVLTGCTGPVARPAPAPTAPSQAIQIPDPTPPPSERPYPCSDAVVTMSMDDWSDTAQARTAMAEVLSAFEAAHPCIKVKTANLPQDARQSFVLDRIRTGIASDLIATGAENIPLYTQAGGLADLTPFIQADPSFKPEEMYFKSVWQAGFYKGVPRAIDKDFSVSAIYVNAGLFARAGLALPQEGWTYDDYLKLALQLTLDKNGHNANSPDFNPTDVVQYGTTLPWLGETDKAWFRGFENVLYSFGAHAISPDATTTVGYLNSAEAVQAWSFYRDLVHKYHVSPTITDLSSIVDNNVTLFEQGKLAMVGAFWGPWYEEAFNATPNLKWAVVPLPSGPGGHKGVIMWLGWSINPKTAHPRQAWELLKWLTTEPGQRVFARRALTQIKSLAAEQQRINDPFWGIFLAETAHVDTLDDTTHPRFYECVADGPTTELLYKTWEPGGDQLDLPAELDQLAAQADQCLATGP